MLRIFLSILPLLFVAGLCRADGLEDLTDLLEDEESVQSSSSSSVVAVPRIKSGDFLPGEEVTTSSGKKMNVWSTRGPVPVSRSADPFADPKKSQLNSTSVIVDVEALKHRKLRDEKASKNDKPRSKSKE